MSNIDDEDEVDKRLGDAIARLPVVEPPAGWRARLDERLQRKRPPRYLRAGIAAATVAALAAGVIFYCARRPAPPRSELAQVVEKGRTPVLSASEAVGDELVVTAKSAAAEVELRLYESDRRIVLRCPGDTRCTQSGSRHGFRFTFIAPGRYRAVLFESASPIPAPTGSGLDDDAQAVEASGGSAMKGKAVVVH